MNYSKLDYDSVKHDNHWYFLIGSNITSTFGVIEDPVLKYNLINKLIIKLHDKK